MKYIKKIIGVIITIILLIVLSFNVFNFISINILNNNLPTINGYAILEVVSGSMEPKISIGDMVIIDTKVKDYKVKDIVTFKDVNNSYVTHRILEITDEGYLTKGDANNKDDGIISKDKIVGKYVYQIDNVGAIMKSLRSPFNLFMILITGTLLCVLVSTDSKGNPILDKEEKEYFEFLEYKNNKDKNKDKKNDINNDESINKKTSEDKVKETKKSKTKVKDKKDNDKALTKEVKVKNNSSSKTKETPKKKTTSKKTSSKNQEKTSNKKTTNKKEVKNKK